MVRLQEGEQHRANAHEYILSFEVLKPCIVMGPQTVRGLTYNEIVNEEILHGIVEE